MTTPLTATISGEFVRPDNGKASMSAYIEAASEASLLTYAGGVIASKTPVKLQADGSAEVTIWQLPQAGIDPADARWRLVMESGQNQYTKEFDLTADITWDDLVDVSGVPPTNTLLAQVTALLAAVQALGTTNDTIISGRVNDKTTPSATRTALDNLYGFFVDVSEPRFGATGNSTTNDRTAIQNAINSIPGQALGVASGATVYFPPGHYKCTSGMTLPAGIKLLGAHGVSGYENANGHMGSVIVAATAGMTLFTVDGGATIIQNGPEFENLIFTDSVVHSCTLFNLRYVNRMRWTNCSFTHSNVAILSGLNNGGDCSWHLWIGCHWYDNVKGVTDSGFGNGGIGGIIVGGNFYLNTSRGLDLGEHSSMRTQGTKFDQTTGICIATKGYRSTFEADFELNGSCIGVQLDGNTAVVPSPQAGYWNVVRAAFVNHGTATGVNITNQAVEAEVDCRFDNFGVGATTIADSGKNTRIKGRNVQVFTAGGTWNKPTWATKVTAICIGAGGGGGSGAVVASGTAASGGGGGGGGGYTVKELPVAALSAAVTITVGAAGGGGAAVGTGASAGAAGTAGGGSFFGPYARAQGGGAGGAGQSAGNSSAGGAGFATTLGGAGGSDTSATAGGSGAGSGAAGGAGAGGGITTGPAATAGGAGGNSSSTSQVGSAGGAINTAGSAGGAVAAGEPSGGAGGSGGGSSITGNGGAGGAGGLYGGGGAGGGAALTTHTSGAGGAGAAGIVIVIAE